MHLKLGYTWVVLQLTALLSCLMHALSGTHIVVLAAGLKLSPGTYHVTAKVEDGFHIYLSCSKDHMQPFEVDFAGVFLYFTVSLRSSPASSAGTRSPK